MTDPRPKPLTLLDAIFAKEEVQRAWAHAADKHDYEEGVTFLHNDLVTLRVALDAQRARPPQAEGLERLLIAVLAQSGWSLVRTEDYEAVWTPPLFTSERLAEILHDLDGTQHYIAHVTGYDGDDMETSECIGGVESHMDDARELLVWLQGEMEPSDD